MKQKPKLHKLLRLGIDFDGTICQSYYDSKSDKWIMGDPTPGIEGVLKKLITKYHKRLWVYTSRADHEYIEVEEWLKKHNLLQYFHGIETGKKLFVLLIDDRAIRFNGNWNETLVEVEKYLINLQ